MGNGEVTQKCVDTGADGKAILPAQMQLRANPTTHCLVNYLPTPKLTQGIRAQGSLQGQITCKGHLNARARQLVLEVTSDTVATSQERQNNTATLPVPMTVGCPLLRTG